MHVKLKVELRIYIYMDLEHVIVRLKPKPLNVYLKRPSDQYEKNPLTKTIMIQTLFLY